MTNTTGRESTFRQSYDVVMQWSTRTQLLSQSVHSKNNNIHEKSFELLPFRRPAAFSLLAFDFFQFIFFAVILLFHLVLLFFSLSVFLYFAVLLIEFPRTNHPTGEPMHSYLVSRIRWKNIIDESVYWPRWNNNYKRVPSIWHQILFPMPQANKFPLIWQINSSPISLFIMFMLFLCNTSALIWFIPQCRKKWLAKIDTHHVANNIQLQINDRTNKRANKQTN